MEIKVENMNGSLSENIPHKILEQMNVAEGDSLDLTQTPDGICLSTRDPEHQAVIKTANKISDRYYQALQELAK